MFYHRGVSHGAIIVLLSVCGLAILALTFAKSAVFCSQTMKLQRLLGTRNRTEAFFAWSIALGAGYYLYQRDKESATKDALAQGVQFSSEDTARWNAQIKADNPKAFTQEAAKAASQSKSAPAQVESVSASTDRS